MQDAGPIGLVPASDRVGAIAMMVLSVPAVLALLRRSPSKVDVLLAGVLGLLALGWLLQSPAYEGPGVLALNSTTGLAAADLGVPPSLLLSVAVLYAAWRDRRGGSVPDDSRPDGSEPEDVGPR